MWTLALFELSHNLLYIMGVAAYLWKKKDDKNTSKWTVPQNLHWIHLEGKFPEVLSDEALGLEREAEHTEQRQEHNTGVPTWDSASTGVFSRKRGRNKSWKRLYQSGERNRKWLWS